MRPARWFAVVLMWAGIAAPAAAQESPRIGYIYPAGGRQGTSVEVAVGGRYLDGATAAEISGEGAHATVVAYVPRLGGQQVNALKTKLRDAEKKKLDAANEAVRIQKQNDTEQAKYDAEVKKWEQEKTKRDDQEKQQRADLERWKMWEQARQQAIRYGEPAPPPEPQPPPFKPLPPMRARPKPPVVQRPKIVWTPQDESALIASRKTIVYAQERRSSAWIGETVVLQITLDAGAPLGERQLRLITRNGVSNARAYCVGQWPEVRVAAITAAPPPKPDPAATLPAPPETRCALPAVLNGQIMPGEINRFRFSATRGQRLVVAVSARKLVPYIADAVPGWFQAVVSLHDATGKCLTYADGYQFSPDPVFYYEVPADGEYGLQIRDSIYRGREDFVYRITVGQIPFVTSVFPLGAKLGSQPTVQVSGWNLPTSQVSPATTRPGVQTVSVGEAGAQSNAVPFAVDELPECFKARPPNGAEQPQKVTLPMIVNGRIEKPGAWDVFSFEGRAGAQVAIEVQARRLGSPLDSVLILTDAAGKRLAFNDDFEDKADPLTTHHADSYLLVTLPVDGTYLVHLGDAQRQGGKEYAYRLRLSAPQPGFELRVVPSGLTVRSAAVIPFTVYALRKDGFTGPIALALKDAPAETTLSGGLIPAEQDKVRLTLAAPPTALKEPVVLSLEGRAVVGGQELVRTAIAADDMMQAFFYHHIVPAGEWRLTVLGTPVPEPALRLSTPGTLTIPLGAPATLRVVAPAVLPEDTLEFQLSEPPDGLNLTGCKASPDGIEITFQSDAVKARVGLRGNLIVSGTAERTIPPAKPDAKPTRRRLPLGFLPAIPFEVVGGRP